MEPASVTSAIDLRLIRILAKMALQLLDQGLDKPSRESLSHGNPEHKGTQETLRDGSFGKPDGDSGEDVGPGRQSATGTPLM
jgi:hypothetical protein